VDLGVLRFGLPDPEPLARLLGGPRRTGEPIEQRHADIAATLQDTTNKIMLNLVRHTYELRPVKDLGLAGGVGLNCTTNYLLKELGPFERIHIPSAPHDGGTAIGGSPWVASCAGWSDRRGPRAPYSRPPVSAPEMRTAPGVLPWHPETPRPPSPPGAGL